MVFRPFKGEVMFARISSCSPNGIHCKLHGSRQGALPTLSSDTSQCGRTFSMTFSSHTMSCQTRQSSKAYSPGLLEQLEETDKAPCSDMNQQLWVWNIEGQRMFYDLHEMVRFRVIDEEWHDQTPTKPIERGEEPEEHRNPPYMIQGSMKDPGLGVCIWWDE